MYWTADRELTVERMERARAAGAIGLIATLDWSFSIGRDWCSPEIRVDDARRAVDAGVTAISVVIPDGFHRTRGAA
jgi:isopentenyl diphosphate isomerase/L-lactate dehydrogenase-like FMN-dependent dehydrogenase